jgi:hypothetical protein
MSFRDTDAWDDADYIVNLTKNLVGHKIIDGIVATHPTGEASATMIVVLNYTSLREQIKKMTDETLGRICSYGTTDGFHTGPASQPVPSFINHTGFKDLGIGHPYITGRNGRQILEEVAIATIICVAHDIARQHTLQETWRYECQMEVDLDRAQRDILHPRRR